VFTLLGELTTSEDARVVSLSVDLDRTDEDTAQASIESRLDLARRELTLDLSASETGGLLAAVLGQADAGDFTLELAGHGPLDDWQGELRVQGEGLGRGEAQIALALAGSTRLRVDGVLEPAPGLLPAPAPEFLGDRLEVALTAVRTDPDRLALEDLRVVGALVELTGSGRVDLGAERVVAQARLAIGDLGPLADVLAMPLTGSLDLHANVDGPLLQPEGRVILEARGIEAAELRAERIETTVDFAALEALTQSGARMHFTAEGRAQGLALPPDVALPPQDVAWRTAMTAPVDGAGTVVVDRLAVNADHLALTAQGTLDATTLGGDARVTLALEALRPFTEPYGQPLDGAADLEATVALGARAELISIELTGSFHQLSGLPPGAAELLGATPTVRANAIVVPADSVDIALLRVKGAAATLDGELDLALPENTLDGTVHLALPRLAVLAPVLGTEINGELTARAEVSGSIGAPAIRLDAKSPGLLLAGEHFDALALTGSARGAPDDLEGAIRLSVTASGLETALATGFELRPPRLRLTNVALSAPQTKLAGDLSLDLERALIDGTLTGRIQELQAFAPLLPVLLRGQVEVEARAVAEHGAQTVTLTARGSDLGSAFGGARRLELQASVADALGTPRITADLRFDDLHQNEVEISRGNVHAEGTPAALNVTTSLTGEVQFVPFTLDGRAGIARGDAIHVRIEEFAGRVAEQPLRLAAPATLTLADGRNALDGLDLRLGRARLTGAFALGPREVTAQATLDPLPLDMLGAFGGAPDLSGQLAARLTLQGPADNPSGTLEARATDVSMSALTLADLPPAELTMTGRLEARRLRLDLSGEGVTEQPIRLNAELPLVVNLASGVFDVPGEGQIAGSLDAEVRLALLADILALDDQRLEGPLIADLSVSGTMAQPDVNGTVRIDNALYENGWTGTVLRDLSLRLRANRQTLAIEQLTANDGGAGRLAGDGTIEIDPAADYPVDLRLRLERAQLVARDDVTATMSGDLTLDGTAAAPILGGLITVNRAEILIPDDLGPSVTVIEVEEVGGRVDARAESDGAGAGADLDLGLDLTLEVPGQVFVRGRGLDSEWQGTLHAEGTVAAPRVTGSLQVRRGTFELLGQRFELRVGTVQFTGATPPNPVLDVQAATRAGDITAVLRVEGEARSPEFKLDSEPSMPEDEIVSRLLFQRAAGGLGPAQAVQLAAAVNTLRGGGLGVLGQARQALGLDTLDVSGEGLQDGRVRAGKYLNDNVYLEAGKGAAAGSEDVRLEVEILPNVSLDASTDAQAQSGVGLKWRYDY
jgi:translocation and assembly module TamB